MENYQMFIYAILFPIGFAIGVIVAITIAQLIEESIDAISWNVYEREERKAREHIGKMWEDRKPQGSGKPLTQIKKQERKLKRERFILYLLRWQLSTPILALCLYFLGFSTIVNTIIANLIGGIIFYFVDKKIWRVK